jgi:hypothetical protein
MALNTRKFAQIAGEFRQREREDHAFPGAEAHK